MTSGRTATRLIEYANLGPLIRAPLRLGGCGTLVEWGSEAACELSIVDAIKPARVRRTDARQQACEVFVFEHMANRNGRSRRKKICVILTHATPVVPLNNAT